jgi:hypothetical protein
MSIAETITGLIRLPRDFNRLRDVSIYSLLQDTGYFEVHGQITEDGIRHALVGEPVCVEEWLCFSADKRTSAGWFFRKGPRGYQVGYFPAERTHDQTVDYSDGAAACAAFVKREIEDIRTDGRH